MKQWAEDVIKNKTEMNEIRETKKKVSILMNKARQPIKILDRNIKIRNITDKVADLITTVICAALSTPDKTEATNTTLSTVATVDPSVGATSGSVVAVPSRLTAGVEATAASANTVATTSPYIGVMSPLILVNLLVTLSGVNVDMEEGGGSVAAILDMGSGT